MKLDTKLLVVLFCLTSLMVGNAQSIYGYWLLQGKYSVCMYLKPSGYSAISVQEYIKPKIRGQNLILYDYYRPRLWIFGRDKYRFKILQLTDTSLILIQDPKNNQEAIGLSGDTLVFKAVKSCDVDLPLR